MPKLKILSEQDIIKIFLSFGFIKSAQKRSRIKLARITTNGVKQTLTITYRKNLQTMRLANDGEDKDNT